MTVQQSKTVKERRCPLGPTCQLALDTAFLPCIPAVTFLQSLLGSREGNPQPPRYLGCICRGLWSLALVLRKWPGSGPQVHPWEDGRMAYSGSSVSDKPAAHEV